MAYCQKCGKKVKGDEDFCPYCGKKTKIVVEKVVTKEKIVEKPVKEKEIIFKQESKSERLSDKQVFWLNAKSWFYAFGGTMSLILSIIIFISLAISRSNPKMVIIPIILFVLTIVFVVLSRYNKMKYRRALKP